MNDKFVVSTNEIGAIIVTDVETDRVYFYDTIYDFFGLIRLLNEQQAIIEEQNNLIEKLRWDLNKTREDLNYFANLKVMAMKGCEPNE